MVRAMSENKETAQLIRDSIIEAMWTDVQDRARKLPGVRRNIINEQVNLLNQQFQYSLIALDEGLLTDDKTLASAVWKRIFEADCEDYRLIELLIVYIRKTVSKLYRRMLLLIILFNYPFSDFAVRCYEYGRIFAKTINKMV